METCKEPWACPNCAPKLALQRRRERLRRFLNSRIAKKARQEWDAQRSASSSAVVK